MRYWKHDEIHRESDALHTQEKANDLDVWAEQLRETIEVNAQAIGCKRLLDLEEQLGEVMDYIDENADGRLGWRKVVNMKTHKHAIRTLEENRAARRICHIVGGKDYVCYCGEKEPLQTRP